MTSEEAIEYLANQGIILDLAESGGRLAARRDFGDISSDEIAFIRQHRAGILMRLKERLETPAPCDSSSLPARIMAALRGSGDTTAAQPARRVTLEELAVELDADESDVALSVCELEKLGALAVEYDKDSEFLRFGYEDFYRARRAVSRRRPSPSRRGA